VTRARARGFTWLRKLGLGSEADVDPKVGELFERRAEREGAVIEQRERRAALARAVATLTAAIALVVLSPGMRPFELGPAIVMLLVFAALERVKFHDGSGYSTPIQLAVVPMLLLLPPAVVPLLVMGGTQLAHMDRLLRGQMHPSRILMGIGDAWFAVGPALVLALAGPEHASWGAWPVYVAALGAQFAFDLGTAVLGEWYAVGMHADLGLRLVGWTWLIDGLLATVGLLAALACRDQPYGVVLVLPLAALLAIFSRERTARIEGSLELGRAYRGTTLLLSDVLDGDDEYTAFHSRGVVALSMAVGDHLGLDERQKRNVEFGALLHDVGKIAIPNEILNKPGKLSADEWVVMETHTVEGQKMLDRVGGVLGQVGRIVRSSHERWDGQGYPDGLAGAAIPLESTIVSACDAFSAMTTHRPYRRALEVHQAIAELRVNAGTQFNPVVVNALIELIEEDQALVGPASKEDEITLVVPDSAFEPAG
jgi:HD-GYP domain-containing protein (c-di-GMP phosphodiesterase class II)